MNNITSFLTQKFCSIYKKKEIPKPKSVLPKPYQHIGLEEYLQMMLEKNKNRNLHLEELILFPEIYDVDSDVPFWSDMSFTCKKRLLKYIDQYLTRYSFPDKCRPIFSYVNEYNFVEIYLENSDLTSDDLPKQIFSCSNLRTLSLKNNRLTYLSPEIGRLWYLDTLVLSGNRLVADSLPYTLTLCVNLTNLYVDDNYLTAVPAFLLKISKLKNVNGRNNVRFEIAIKNCHSGRRVGEAGPRQIEHGPTVKSLIKLSVVGIASGKLDYFWVDGFAEDYQNLVSKCFRRPICDACYMPREEHEGYSIFSLSYGKFSKQWIPIAHYACSRRCVSQLLPTAIHNEELCLNQFVDERYSRRIQRRSTRKH